jgi:hypothetical protein
MVHFDSDAYGVLCTVDLYESSYLGTRGHAWWTKSGPASVWDTDSAPPYAVVPRTTSWVRPSLTQNAVRIHCSSTELISVYYFTSSFPYYLLLHWRRSLLSGIGCYRFFPHCLCNKRNTRALSRKMDAPTSVAGITLGCRGVGSRSESYDQSCCCTAATIMSGIYSFVDRNNIRVRYTNVSTV